MQAAVPPPGKPLILCVDDEPLVLDGLKATLFRRFEVVTATSGAIGLGLLATMPAQPIAIVSDMRMPQMDGAAFLTKARAASPRAVRILLTGQADVASAIAVVNDGQIFRFLTKPCSTAQLVASLDAAVEQHRLVDAEQVLLEQTLRGCMKALTEVLALASPIAFGRAMRIRQRVTGLLDRLAITDRWQLDVAAMVSQLGAITLPPDTVEKLYHGHALTPDEQRMVALVPAVSEQLLGSIPRLDAVRAIITAYARPPHRAPGQTGTVYRDAAILRLATDYDTLEAEGVERDAAFDILRGRGELYDPALLDALVALVGVTTQRAVREVALAGLRAGMILVEDLMRSDGMLLLARGVEVSASVLERMKNFRTGTVREPIRVLVVDDGGDELRRLLRPARSADRPHE